MTCFFKLIHICRNTAVEISAIKAARHYFIYLSLTYGDVFKLQSSRIYFSDKLALFSLKKMVTLNKGI